MHPICYESTLNHHETLSKVDYSNAWKETGYGHLVVVYSFMRRGASPLNALYPFYQAYIEMIFLESCCGGRMVQVGFFYCSMRWVMVVEVGLEWQQ